MKSIEQVKRFNDKKFQKTFGVNRATFSVMLEVLEKQFQDIFFAYYRDKRTIADIAI